MGVWVQVREPRLTRSNVTGVLSSWLDGLQPTSRDWQENLCQCRKHCMSVCDRHIGSLSAKFYLLVYSERAW